MSDGEGAFLSDPHSDSLKQRIRWTEDLHGQFVEVVRSLGGCDKATPKQVRIGNLFIDARKLLNLPS